MQSENNPTSSGWAFHAEDTSGLAPNADRHNKPDSNKPITWTASEFIAHHKSPGWYFGLFASITLITALVYVTTKDAISTVSISIVGILFAILSSKTPRQLTYAVDNRGISIGDKFYPYTLFKSFSIHQEGAIGYVNLLPLKRFMPELTMYLAPESGEDAVKTLSNNLPYEHKQERGVDRLMKQLRF